MEMTENYINLSNEYYSLVKKINKEIKDELINFIGVGNSIDMCDKEDRICIDYSPNANEYDEFDMLETITINEHNEIILTSTYGECNFDDIALCNRMYIYEYFCKPLNIK